MRDLGAGAKRVFVVEDEAIVAMELKDHLRTFGFEVCGHATSGDAALREIPALKPDLVLLDINLGRGLSGLDVAEQLRGVVDVPLVFVTAYADAELATNAARTESFGYIVKPFQVQALRAGIEIALLRHEATRRVRESEQRFRALFEQAAVGVAEVDAQTGRVVRANARLAAITGYGGDELCALDLVQLAHPDERAGIADHLIRLRSGSVRELSFEIRALAKDGATVWVGASMSAMWAAGEPPTQLILVLQDIGERRRASEALRASEAKLAGVIAIAPDAIISVDRAQRIVIFNEGAEAIFGWPRAEVIGQRFDLLIPARLREAHARHFAAFARAPDNTRVMLDRRELVAMRRGGAEFPAEASISKLAVDDGPLFTVVLRDVSERKRQEQALRESEARFRGLFEDAIEGVFRVCPDGRLLDVNPAVVRMLGHASAAALIGTSVLELCAEPDERARIAADHAASDTMSGLETRWRKKSGEIIPVEVSLRRFFDEHGRVSHLQGFVRDLSEQRARDARVDHLRRHAEQLELVLEGTRLGFWDWNPKTNVMRFSERCAEMLGYQHEEISPDLEAWNRLIHPDDLAASDAALRAHVEGRCAHYESVYRMRHADGRWIYVLDRGRIFARDEHGQPTRFCGTHTDVTAEKEAERLAIEANRAKTHFLANMSHELRTPLNAILGLSEALLERAYGDLTARQERSLQTILSGGRHLRDLIDDVLDIARIEAGKLSIAPRELALVPFVDDCVALVSPLAQARDQRILTELEPDLTTFRADGRRLKQVLVNMLTNAIKFSPDGSEITLGARGHADAGALELWVADTGIGVAVDQRERIFEPFFTLDPGLTREQSGAGLGLALVKHLVELHGGTVAVQSEPGIGAKFVVRLPWGPAMTRGVGRDARADDQVREVPRDA